MLGKCPTCGEGVAMRGRKWSDRQGSTRIQCDHEVHQRAQDVVEAAVDVDGEPPYKLSFNKAREKQTTAVRALLAALPGEERDADEEND